VLHALVDGAVVLALVDDADGGPPLAERFHPSLTPISLSGAPPQVTVGWYYDGSGFSPPPPPPGVTSIGYIPVHVVRERMEARGSWADMVAVLFAPANQAAMLKVLTLSQGIDPADTDAHALITAAGDDPNIILAPLT
jgi:hypothetical protein